MAEFRAEAGVEYVNPVSGHKVNFSAADLQNPAIGFLSSQYQKATGAQPAPIVPAASPSPTAAPSPLPAPAAPSVVAPVAPIQTISSPAQGIQTFPSLSSLMSSSAFMQAAPGTIFRSAQGQQYYKTGGTSGGNLAAISSVSQLQDLAKLGVVKPGSDVYYDIAEPPPPPPILPPAGTLKESVAAANGSLKSNADFVNAAFRAYHGRDANAAELQQFVGQSVDYVRNVVQSGALPAAKGAVATTELATTIPDTINATDIGIPELAFPTVPDATSGDDAFIRAIQSLYQNPEYKAALATQTGLMESLKVSQAALLGRGQRTRDLEAQAGIPDSLRRLKELDAAVASKMAAMNLGEAQIADQTIPADLLVGQQASFRRQQLAEVGALQAEREAVAGNLDLAYQIVDRTVGLEFDPIEQSIKNTLDFISLNKDALDRADKKRAEDLSVILTLRQDAVADARANKQANMNLMAEVAAAGGDVRGLNLNGSFQENLKVAQPYLRNPKRETQVVNVGGRSALIDTQTGDVIKELGVATGDGKTQMVETADGLLLVDSATGSTIKNFGTGAQRQQRVDTRVNQLADNFTKEETVKNFNQVASAFATASSLSNESATSADDIALVYAFAKAMDPSSAVRGEEYDSIQRNSQSWVQVAGVNLSRILENKEFLNPEARRKLKSAIETKYGAYKTQYDTVYEAYANQINRVTGGRDGTDWLVDYSRFNAAEGAADISPGVLKDMEATGERIFGDVGAPTADSTGGRTIHGVDAATVLKLASAIGHVESRGWENPYVAKGVVVTGGRYKGDRALGKYQVMGLNVPSWSKEALGKSLTPDEFLNSPEAQDAVAAYKIAQLWKKYGNVDDVASAWFTGGPLAKNARKTDDVGTSASQYVALVRSALNRLT